jgi:hypothetical protein
VWDAIADPAWKPTETAAVVGLRRAVTGGSGSARFTADTSDHQRLAVTAPDGGFLRVSGAWHRGWRATLDGRKVPVLRADGMFRGVELPPGDHVVDFRFVNPNEARGRLVAPLALLAIAAGVLMPRFRRLTRPPPPA